MASNLSELSAGEIAAHVIRGELPRTVRRTLERYHAQRELNAITWIDEARVLEELVPSTSALARQSWGSSRASSRRQGQHRRRGYADDRGNCRPARLRGPGRATVLRVRAHDAVILGKANVHELALGCTSSNLATGTSAIPTTCRAFRAARAAAAAPPSPRASSRPGSVRTRRDPCASRGAAGRGVPSDAPPDDIPVEGLPLAKSSRHHQPRRGRCVTCSRASCDRAIDRPKPPRCFGSDSVCRDAITGRSPERSQN